MKISEAMEKMIEFEKGHLGRIAHLMRVHNFAKTIGELEGLDADTQETLELTAIIHDIGIGTAMEKYGTAAGPYQEKEGEILAREFYANTGISQEKIDRIAFLVGHHHTYTGVDGIDYQIMLEADYLVNAEGHKDTREAIMEFEKNVFKTESGKRILHSIYLREE